MLNSAASPDLPEGWLDRLRRGREARAKARAEASSRTAAPMLLSDRVKAWLDGLPEDVIRKGLLTLDVADEFGTSDRRAEDLLRLHRWWQSFGRQVDRPRWLPPWAALHPEEQPWTHSDGCYYAADREFYRVSSPAPPGWVRKPMWWRPDGSWVWW